jgi:hypothetical protein
LFVAVARGRKVDRELSGLTVIKDHVPDFATRCNSNWSSSHSARDLAEADQGYQATNNDVTQRELTQRKIAKEPSDGLPDHEASGEET